MRTAILTLILIGIVSTFALAEEPAAPARDSRLAQKVTYRVKLRPMADLTNDLSKMTHITFSAGRSNADWRVREDCATVVAKDVPLATLMDSIAHALKFRWVRSGAAPSYAYRLTEDPAAVAAIKDKEDDDKQKTIDRCHKVWDRALNAASMSATDLARIKDTDPWMYLAAKTGILQPTVEFFQQAPEAREAFLSGEKIKLASCWLPPKARQSLVKATQATVRLESTLSAQDQDSLQARLTDIESKADQLTIEVTGSAFAVQVDGITSPGGIPTTDSDFLTMIAQTCIKAYDQNRPLLDLINEDRPRLKEAANKERERLQAEKPPLGCDPGAIHPADLLKTDLLAAKAESKVITGLVESLADASGYAIVTADLRGSSDLSFDKGASVREALDKMAETFALNWNKNGHTLEMWPSDWHERRESRVSKAWLESIKTKLKRDRTLNIDDISQIAALTDGQFSSILKDDVLSCLSSVSADDREFLKIYALFSADQRSVLFSDSGLSYAHLAQDQQQAILKLLKTIYIPAIPSLDLGRLGLRILGTKEGQGDCWVYKISGAIGGFTIPGQYELKTPMYVPPAVPDPAAVPAPAAK